MLPTFIYVFLDTYNTKPSLNKYIQLDYRTFTFPKETRMQIASKNVLKVLYL